MGALVRELLTMKLVVATYSYSQLATYRATNYKLLVSRPGETMKSMRVGGYYYYYLEYYYCN